MAKNPIEVTALKHDAATRRNIPTAEYESVMREEDKTPIRLAYERRNRDLDPQLVWRGKDEQDWSDLIVSAPPLYIQEKVHPKVIIDDLKREAKKRNNERADAPLDLFADFNGLKDKEAATEFYQHDQHWSNRMISGDSLSVMASLAEREGLRGQVQCIYFDPPYGIKFNSNFQWSTTSRDVKDGAKDHIILARRRDPLPSPLLPTPTSLRLTHEPVADCARYDTLRRTTKHGTHSNPRPDGHVEALRDSQCL